MRRSGPTLQNPVLSPPFGTHCCRSWFQGMCGQNKWRWQRRDRSGPLTSILGSVQSWRLRRSCRLGGVQGSTDSHGLGDNARSDSQAGKAPRRGRVIPTRSAGIGRSSNGRQITLTSWTPLPKHQPKGNSYYAPIGNRTIGNAKRARKSLQRRTAPSRHWLHEDS